MSRMKARATRAAGLSRRSVALWFLGFLLLFAQQPGKAQSLVLANNLKFFQNYFITGDYRVGTVDLSGGSVGGFGTGDIHFNDTLGNKVPPKAEIIAAFLYWEMITLGPGPADVTDLVGATFRGYDLSEIAKPLSSTELDKETSPCWSGGAGDVFTMTMFRTDVLRFLIVPPPSINGGNALVNDEDYAAADLADPADVLPLRVRLPEGNGNNAPSSAGASLVVIYRIAAPDTAPLRSIVIYDGIHTQEKDKVTKNIDGMQKTLQGFYHWDSAGPAAKMTHLVGSGAKNDSDQLFIDNLVTPISLNSFVGTDSPGSDRGWGSVTKAFTVSNVEAQEVTTKVNHLSNSPYDCLSWAAIILSGNVMDSDGDGLLNKWELSTAGPDPNGQPLPDLAAMGADPNHKDLFVEIGYMKTDPATSPDGVSGVKYGGELKPHHTHLPTQAALEWMGDAFKNAPVANPLSTQTPKKGINVHFDVGNNYQGTPYIISTGAQGGEFMDEMVTVCTRDMDDPPWICQFGNNYIGSGEDAVSTSPFPGTVGWKTGYRRIRDEPLVLSEEVCDTYERDGDTTTNCTRRFDSNRMDMFHYVFAAHFLGVPINLCLNPDGSADTACQVNNPDFHVPRTNTGIADLSGADILLALGGFDDSQGKPVGTTFMQASALMHELGHNFERRHGGDPDEDNCKPNYLSIMSYLFQLRALFKEGDPAPHLDYSGQRLGQSALDESNLSNGDLIDLDDSTKVPLYRTAWYVPQQIPPIGPNATKHCDGSMITAGESAMVRIDGSSLGIDWNPYLAEVLDQDINFNGFLNDGFVHPDPPLGVVRPKFAGSNDWANLRLNQIGSRRNVGGLYEVGDSPPCLAGIAPCQGFGPLSLGVVWGDLAPTDLGQGSWGQGSWGQGSWGQGSWGQGSWGASDLSGQGSWGQGSWGQGSWGQGSWGQGSWGQGSWGQGSWGQGDLDVGGPDEPLGEPDVGIVNALNGAPQATADSYTVSQDTTLNVPARGVLVNDADPDGASASLTAVLVEGTGPSHAAAFTLNPDGSFTYTPAPGYIGPDSFKYTANDVSRSSNLATVTITVTPLIYSFNGFLSPLPLANASVDGEGVTKFAGSFTKGKTLPLKWKLTLNGIGVTNLETLNYIRAWPRNFNNCSVTLAGDPVPIVVDGVLTGATTYRFDSNNQQFIVNWDTTDARLSKTVCYRIKLKLNDAGDVKYIDMKFK